MNLQEYMAIKYRGAARALLKKEADIFGVPYPLRAGWVDKYGEIEITQAMAQRLRAILGNSPKRSAQRALQALGEAYFGKQPNMLEQLIIEAKANPAQFKELVRLVQETIE